MYYFRQVQASNDVSLLDHELFSLYVHIVVVVGSKAINYLHLVAVVLRDADND